MVATITMANASPTLLAGAASSLSSPKSSREGQRRSLKYTQSPDACTAP